eukprot:m51a1_g14031 hypothetical protein (278) ;mRNA; f:1127433-1136936
MAQHRSVLEDEDAQRRAIFEAYRWKMVLLSLFILCNVLFLTAVLTVPANVVAYFFFAYGKTMEQIEGKEDQKTIQVCDRVGRAFLKFLDNHALTVKLVKYFLRIDTESYTATSMYMCHSHLLKFIERNFWVHIQKDRLTAIDNLLAKKMEKHKKKKANTFTEEEVFRFLNTDEQRSMYNFTLNQVKARGTDHIEQSFFIPFMVYMFNLKELVEQLCRETGGSGRIWRHHGNHPLGQSSVAKVPRTIAKILELPEVENAKLLSKEDEELISSSTTFSG